MEWNAERIPLCSPFTSPHTQNREGKQLNFKLLKNYGTQKAGDTHLSANTNRSFVKYGVKLKDIKLDYQSECGVCVCLIYPKDFFGESRLSKIPLTEKRWHGGGKLHNSTFFAWKMFLFNIGNKREEKIIMVWLCIPIEQLLQHWKHKTNCISNKKDFSIFSYRFFRWRSNLFCGH